MSSSFVFVITGPLRGLDRGCEVQPRALGRLEMDIAGLPAPD